MLAIIEIFKRRLVIQRYIYERDLTDSCVRDENTIVLGELRTNYTTVKT